MPPWGYTDILPTDYSQLESAALIATAAIKQLNGLSYKIGPPYKTISCNHYLLKSFKFEFI